jgi:competence protein ComEC
VKIPQIFYLTWATAVGIIVYPFFQSYFNFPIYAYLVLSLLFLVALFFLSRGRLLLTLLAFIFLAQFRCALLPPVSFLALSGESRTVQGIVKRSYENSFLLEVKSFSGKRSTGEVQILGVEGEEGEEIYLRGTIIKSSLYQKPLVYASQKKVLAPPPAWRRYTSFIRNRISSNLKRDLPLEERVLISGILWGEKKGIPPYVKESFVETGTGHLLAVSGLHVGIVFLLFYFLFSIFRLPLYLRFLLSLFPSLAYCALAGFTPSVTRAFLMLALGMGGWLYGGRRALISTLSLSALFLLIWNPSYLFNVSFELSYLAVMGIALLSPFLTEIFTIFPLSLRKALVTTLSAQIFTFPIVVKEFGVVSFVSPLANMVVIPLLFPLLLLSLALSFLYFLPFSLSQLILPFLHLIASLVYKSISLFSSLPISYVTFSTSSSLFIWISLLGFLLVMKGKFRISLKHLIFASLLLLNIFLFYPAFEPPFKVIFFNVGQGDSALVFTKEGSILIDAGPSTFLLREKMRKFSIKKVDCIVLSHLHQDHMGGISLFYFDPRVKKVFTPSSSDSSEWNELKQGFSEKIERIDRERAFKFGKLILRFNFVDVPGEVSNDEQLILRVEYKGLTFLFTGDAGKEVQRELMEKEWIKSYILKVPHHGSSDFDPRFIHKVAPFIGIISVGRNNKYSHPSSKVLAELRGVKVFRTDRDGDLLLEEGKKKIKVTCFK